MSPLPDDTRLSSKNNNDDNQSTSEECLIPVGVVPIILFLAIVVSALFLEHPRRKIYSAFVAMKNTLLRKSAMTESASQSLLEPYKLTETDLREKTYTEAMPCDGPSKLKVSEENNIVDVDWVLTSLRSGRNNSGYYDFTLRKVPPRKQVRLSIMCKGESESDLQDIKTEHALSSKVDIATVHASCKPNDFTGTTVDVLDASGNFKHVLQSLGASGIRSRRWGTFIDQIMPKRTGFGPSFSATNLWSPPRETVTRSPSLPIVAHF